MTTDLWRCGEIEVVVSGLFTTTHTFRTSSATLGSLKVSFGTGKTRYQWADGASGSIRSRGFTRPRYELIEDGAIRGTAAPFDFPPYSYAIRFDDRGLELVPDAFVHSNWLLVDSLRGVLLHTELPRRLLRGTCLVVERPVELPLATLAYFLYTVIQSQSGPVI